MLETRVLDAQDKIFIIRRYFTSFSILAIALFTKTKHSTMTVMKRVMPAIIAICYTKSTDPVRHEPASSNSSKSSSSPFLISRKVNTSMLTAPERKPVARILAAITTFICLLVETDKAYHCGPAREFPQR